MSEKKKNSWIVASFYTPEYNSESIEWIKSANKFDIDFVLTKYKHDTDTWEKRCQKKAIFIKSILTIYKTNILWIDIDAQINQYPNIFDNINSDIAYHIHPKTKEVLSGTLYMKYHSKMIDFCDDWSKEMENNHNLWDQIALERTIRKWKSKLNIYLLPEKYCYIFDSPNKLNPVITQYQASRKYKGKINDKHCNTYN